MKPMSPKNEPYIIKEGPISDGNNPNHLILFKVCLFLKFPFQISGDGKYIMASTHEIQKLLISEFEFAEHLKSYLKLLQDQVSKVETFIKLNNYTDNFNKENLGDLKKYVIHPINAYGVILRTSLKQRQILDLNNNQICHHTENLKNLTENFPTTQDLQSASGSIALLQVVIFSNYIILK